MTNDIFMVFGIIIGAFAFPALVGAFSESRPPRAAAILIMIGGGLVAIAMWQTPSGYELEDIPQLFVKVFSELIP